MSPSYLRALVQENALKVMALSLLHTPLTAEKWAASYWKIGPGKHQVPVDTQCLLLQPRMQHPLCTTPGERSPLS
jgi:hypothetical protein